ncbi:MAG: proteasome accessory factor PafA2 family protein [Planctomycetes bacterium]|nr:proteasome accessory factor PafA2 family protein [Planctomycetota bacterium]
MALPKWMGFDCEWGNALLGRSLPRDSSVRASLLLLEAVRPHGVRLDQNRALPRAIPEEGIDLALTPPAPLCRAAREGEYGRTWMLDRCPGSCAYVDLGHFETCSPEVSSARELLLSWTAWRYALEEARRVAQGWLPRGVSLWASASLTDGGVCWGHHTNTLVSAELWKGLMKPGPVQAGYLAFAVSSILVGGAGGWSAEGPTLTQRGRFLETIVGVDTTGCTGPRPIINSRREPFARGRERYHAILHDSPLAPLTFLLSRGLHALALALLEDRPRALADLELADPIRALHEWDRDPSLRATARLADGRRFTLVEMGREIHARFHRYLDEEDAETSVPGARDLVERFGETLDLCARGDRERLARRIQWVLRHRVLERVRGGMEGEEARMIDQCFDALDPECGIYVHLEAEGASEGLPARADVERFLHEAPRGRAAWRSAILGRMRDEVVAANWNVVETLGSRGRRRHVYDGPDGARLERRTQTS